VYFRLLLKLFTVKRLKEDMSSAQRDSCKFKQCRMKDKPTVLIIKANRCTISQIYFGKDLHMFRTDLLSIIRSLNMVFTAIGICHTGYVNCLLARSGWNSTKTPDDGQ